MSKFTFIVANNSGDETEPHLMLTAASDSGLQGIQVGKSTFIKDFFATDVLPAQAHSVKLFKPTFIMQRKKSFDLEVRFVIFKERPQNFGVLHGVG